MLVHCMSYFFCKVGCDLAQIDASYAPCKRRKLGYVHDAFTCFTASPVSVEFDVGTFDKPGPAFDVLFDGGIELVGCDGVGFET